MFLRGSIVPGQSSLQWSYGTSGGSLLCSEAARPGFGQMGYPLPEHERREGRCSALNNAVPHEVSWRMRHL